MKTLIVSWLLSLPLQAEKAGLKIDDLGAGEHDTSIVIQKGAGGIKSCVKYEILSESSEIAGDPEYDKSKARANWKSACDAWKKEVRDTQLGTLVTPPSCNAAHETKEGNLFSYKSTGSYKTRVKVQE